MHFNLLCKNNYRCTILLCKCRERNARKLLHRFRFTSYFLRPVSQSITRSALQNTCQSKTRKFHSVPVTFRHNSSRWGNLQQQSLPRNCSLARLLNTLPLSSPRRNGLIIHLPQPRVSSTGNTTRCSCSSRGSSQIKTNSPPPGPRGVRATKKKTH